MLKKTLKDLLDYMTGKEVSERDTWTALNIVALVILSVFLATVIIGLKKDNQVLQRDIDTAINEIYEINQKVDQEETEELEVITVLDSIEINGELIEINYDKDTLASRFKNKETTTIDELENKTIMVLKKGDDIQVILEDHSLLEMIIK